MFQILNTISAQSSTYTIIAFLVLLLLVCLLFSAIFIVKQQTEAIIERFGKFKRVCSPGLHIKIPVIDRIAKRVERRIQQLDLVVETKTKDNVFVSIPVSVQFQVQDSAASFYSLSNPNQQITSYVFDRVRSSLSQLNLDEAFSSKDTIAQEIEVSLGEQMARYGFKIVNSLVTDINPDKRVRESMNSINAAQREREAAIQLAEADKIKLVKQAEADAESKRLQGEGIALQRRAIVEGLVEQYESLRDAGIGDQAQQILLMTQYFDTLAEVAKYSKSQTLMLPSNPNGVTNTMEEIRNSLVAGIKAAGQGE